VDKSQTFRWEQRYINFSYFTFQLRQSGFSGLQIKEMKYTIAKRTFRVRHYWTVFCDWYYFFFSSHFTFESEVPTFVDKSGNIAVHHRGVIETDSHYGTGYVVPNSKNFLIHHIYLEISHYIFCHIPGCCNEIKVRKLEKDWFEEQYSSLRYQHTKKF